MRIENLPCSHIAFHEIQDFDVQEVVITSSCESTLEQQHYPDSAGGYTLQDPVFQQKRIISWTTSQHILTLTDNSFSSRLTKESLRLKFESGVIVPSISISETAFCISVLVATVSTAYRLRFPIENGSGSSFFHNWDSCLNVTQFQFNLSKANILAVSSSLFNDANIFTVCFNNGIISLISMKEFDSSIQVLQHGGKWWQNVLPSSFYRQSNVCPEASSALTMFPFGRDLLISVVCNNNQLRIFSYTSRMRVIQTDLLTYLPGHSFLSDQPANCRKIHVESNCSSETPYFGVFLSIADVSTFIVLQPCQDSRTTQFSLLPVANLSCSDVDTVIDFALDSSLLIAIIEDSQGNASVQYSSFNSSTGWCKCLLLKPPTLPELHASMDPRQTFLNMIFSGEFTTSQILRVLEEYNSTSSSSEKLRSRVVNAIEARIRSSMVDYDVRQEQYYNGLLENWQYFYSALQKERYADQKAIGIFLSSSNIFIRHHASVSYLVESDVSKAAMDCNDTSLVFRGFLPEDDCDDIELLMSALREVNTSLDASQLEDIQRVLFLSGDFDAVIDSICNDLNSDDDYKDCAFRLHTIFSNVTNLYQTVSLLLNIFKLDYLDESYNDCSITDLSFSMIGDSISNEFLYSIIMNLRYLSSSRMMFFIQFSIVLRFNLRYQDDVISDNELHNLYAEVCVLLRYYFLVSWLCNAFDPEELHSSVTAPDFRKSILGVFVSDHITNLVCKYISSQNSTESSDIATFVQNLSYLILHSMFPLHSSSIQLDKYILENFSSCRTIDYARIVSWCNSKISSLSYIKANAMLAMEEAEKACDILLNLDINESLMIYIDTVDEFSVAFFSQAILLFEDKDYVVHTLKILQNAIHYFPEDHQCIPNFRTKLFVAYLKLADYHSACNAISANPKHITSNVHLLVVNLHDTGNLHLLRTLPIAEISDQILAVLEMKASQKSLSIPYNEALCSFHINKGNYRRAASTMYAYAQRLAGAPGSENILRNVRAFSIVLNCLRQCKPENSWILVHIKDPEIKNKQKRLVIQLEDVERDYFVAQCRLKYSNIVYPNTPDVMCPFIDQCTMLTFLCKHGFFDDALILSDMFHLDQREVFEAIAARCIELDDESWLELNEIPRFCMLLPSTERKWAMLNTYLAPSSSYSKLDNFRTVLSFILSKNLKPPQSFIDLYCSLNKVDVIHCYTKHGWLKEATELAIQYLNKVNGIGLSLKADELESTVTETLLCRNPQLYVPYDLFEHILSAFERSEGSEYRTLSCQFRELLTTTIDKTVNVCAQIKA